MRHIKVDLTAVWRVVRKTANITIKLLRELHQKTKPLLGLVWQNKIMLVSVINAVIAGALVILLSIRFFALLSGNNYWWVVGEQSGILSDNKLDYIRSIAQNNVPVVFIALAFAGLLLIQTIRITTKAKTEKWDKKGRHKWLKQLSLVFYLVLVITLMVVFIE